MEEGRKRGREVERERKNELQTLSCNSFLVTDTRWFLIVRFFFQYFAAFLTASLLCGFNSLVSGRAGL